MDDDRSRTVLDHIDQISVPGNVFDNAANEYWALRCWWDGLELLFGEASKANEEAVRTVNPDGNVNYIMFGGNIGPRTVRYTILNCVFQWYAVTACQYVRTIGTIAKKHDSRRPKPLDYIRSVIPDVLSYRDHVAAHLSFSMKHSNDSEADRVLSCLPQLIFETSAFVVSPWKLTVVTGDSNETAEFGRPWSVTQIHQALRQRYRPDLIPQRLATTLG